MKREHSKNSGMVAFRDAYCAVQTLLQAEGMNRMMQMRETESWQDADGGSGLDLTLVSVLAHQLEHVSEDLDADPVGATSKLAAVAELLLPAVEKRIEETNDVLARHAALVTRNLLTALIEQVERDQSEEAQESDEESSPPHEPGGREAPATIRIPNNLQS